MQRDSNLFQQIELITKFLSGLEKFRYIIQRNVLESLIYFPFVQIARKHKIARWKYQAIFVDGVGLHRTFIPVHVHWDQPPPPCFSANSIIGGNESRRNYLLKMIILTSGIVK